MKKVRPLRKGDTILLMAPSSPLRPNVSLDAIVAGLRGAGYNIVFGDSLYGSTAAGYAAAPASVRVADLHRGFSDPAIHAIWAVRGGSMAMELLPLLDYDLIAANPKPLLGFSDITALHLAIMTKCGMRTFHSPCASIFRSPEEIDPYTLESLDRAMLDRPYEFVQPEGRSISIIRSGSAEGILFGGNLSLVAALIGTPYFPDPTGKILFIEDIDEDVYSLNRLLLHLKLAGIFDRVSGVLLGEFTDCKNTYSETYTASDLMRDFLSQTLVPVYADLAVGHVSRNAALPLGSLCTMENGIVRFD